MTRLPLPARWRRPASSPDDGDAGPAPQPAAPSRPAEDTPGLYAVLGVPRSASDAEIHARYRKRAAMLANNRFARPTQLKELNAAYEVLGNSARRADYDRWLDGHPDGSWQLGPDTVEHATPRRYPRFRHPRRAESARRGAAELFGIVLVIAVATVAGAWLLERVVVDLSPVTSVTGVLGLTNPGRRSLTEALQPGSTASPGPSPVATRPAAAPTSQPPTPIAAATPTAQRAAAEEFQGSGARPLSTNPARNSNVSIQVTVVREGRPVADADVWITAQFLTVRERWPNQGAVKTGPDGVATVTFNIGDATPGFEVKVEAFALVDGRQVSWPTSFTPR